MVWGGDLQLRLPKKCPDYIIIDFKDDAARRRKEALDKVLEAEADCDGNPTRDKVDRLKKLVKEYNELVQEINREHARLAQWFGLVDHREPDEQVPLYAEYESSYD